MAEQETNARDKVALTRRQAVAAIGAGIVVLGATNVGTAYEAAQWGREQTLPQATDLQSEVEKLRGLIALYETLDKIGIDAIISGAMSAFGGALDTLRGGVGLLSSGLTAAEDVISSFRNTFASIRDGLSAAEGAVSGLASLLTQAETWLGQATQAARPVLEQVRQFFDDLLSKIPFGVGDNMRKAIDALVGLVGAIPGAILQVNTRLLEPLRTGWFSDDNAKNIQGALLDPITQNVLDPLSKFLGEVDQALARWRTDVTMPVQSALDQRADVRKQIAEYKKQNGMS